MTESKEQIDAYYVAEFDYDAQVAIELSFKEGQTFFIEYVDSSGWFFTKNAEGRGGFVPSNYFVPVDKNKMVGLGGERRLN